NYPSVSFRDFFRMFGASADSEALESYAEVLLASDEIRKVVFGHSRIPNYRQFGNGKEYFNQGTWTRSLSLDMRSLGSSHRLTYVLFEWTKDQTELQGKLMEWQGKHEVISDYV